MSQNSPRLKLPLMQPSQSQKHVTHNEALRILDLATQLTIHSFDANTPPSLPQEGEVHAVGSAPTGAWADHAGKLAIYVDADWQFLTPATGWAGVDAVTLEAVVFDGTEWIDAAPDLENADRIGINTAPDATNRLALSSAASLFTHEGAGHRIKVNKASANDTASVLFQTNWSGRAEFGLAGDDAFSIKLSADGSTWEEALRVSPGETVYHSGNVVGAVNAGAIIETGSNANGSYTIFADGTMICTTKAFASASGAAAVWTFPKAFTNTDAAVTATIAEAGANLVSVNAVSTSSVNVHTYDLTGAETVSPLVNLTAIGRYF